MMIEWILLIAVCTIAAFIAGHYIGYWSGFEAGYKEEDLEVQ